MRKIVGVILAGGTGSRMGVTDTPKQFLRINGITILEYAISAYEACDEITEICIVCNVNYLNITQEIVQEKNYKKIITIIPGGATRSESSLAAIQKYHDDDLLLFNDAVRPLITQRVINECIRALDSYNVVNTGVTPRDTIFSITDKNNIDAMPQREILRCGQTPQGFKCGVIKKAYELSKNRPGFKSSDDCGVIRAFLPNEKIYVIDGDPFNIKVTYEDDLSMIESLILKRVAK